MGRDGSASHIMNTITIHVNRNNLGIGYTVTLTGATGAPVVTLKGSDFKSAGDGTSDEVATVKDFPAEPKFPAELRIGAGGGGRATATFFVDGQKWQPVLAADFRQTKDRKEVTP